MESRFLAALGMTIWVRWGELGNPRNLGTPKTPGIPGKETPGKIL
jgi:hypothetical protein